MRDEDMEMLKGKEVSISWMDELLGRQTYTGVYSGEEEGEYCLNNFAVGVRKDAKGLIIKEIVN